jgi:hypothetical protein
MVADEPTGADDGLGPPTGVMPPRDALSLSDGWEAAPRDELEHTNPWAAASADEAQARSSTVREPPRDPLEDSD